VESARIRGGRVKTLDPAIFYQLFLWFRKLEFRLFGLAIRKRQFILNFSFANYGIQRESIWQADANLAVGGGPVNGLLPR
jgi:hypothetical protein